MIEIQPPNPLIINKKSVFLAGSIEMGVAEEWQKTLTNLLKDEDIIILNPRRDDWDSSWEQSIYNKEFREQVEWELEALERADMIIMHFDENTKSPITLAELGLFAKSGKLVVHCPDAFWRKGNVDIICNKYRVERVDSFHGIYKKILIDLKLV